MRRFLVLLIVEGLAAFTAPAVANAASFTAQPPTYVQSGAGPFEWRFVSSDPGGPDGSYAYKLGTENVWHRCGKDYPAMLSGLPDGVYSVTIANDIDLDWYAARGMARDGVTQPCWDNPTATGPDAATTTSMLYVDGAPPTVSEPRVVASGNQAIVSVDAADGISGVDTIQWMTGDGYLYSGQTYIRHQYIAAGTWHGSVTVTDHAGNSTVRTFAVTVAPPVPSPTPPASTHPAPPSAHTDTTPPRLRLNVSTHQRVSQRHSVLLRVRCSERCTLTARGTLALRGHRYRLSGRSMTLQRRKSSTLRLAVGARARRALRRTNLRKHRAVATIRLSWRDTAGNDASRKLQVRAL